ncbi:MAG: hypothetical protein M3N98_10900, partial [Actinomycetota bacterium]|nr:hypothetical protein [Actinomycetota bacterium]
MRLRWPRALLASSIVVGTATLGVGAIGVGTAAAVQCGSIAGVAGVCPTPSGVVSASPSSTGGPSAIKSSWTNVATDGRITNLHVTVMWTSTGGPSGAPQPAKTSVTDVILSCQTVAPAAGGQECDVAWPSDLESNGFVLNGTYSLTVTAIVCPANNNPLIPCSQPGSATGTAGVRNQPGAPPNVKATLVGNAVKVTWDPSPEPDVFAYAVRRSGLVTPVGGCQVSFAPADLKGLPTCSVPLSVTDSSSGGGDFSYQVTAIRFGDTYAFDHSVEAVATTAKVTVPGPPATTVAPGAGGTPGGGLPFGVFNTPKVKPSSSNPVVGLNPKALPGGGVPTATTVDPGFSPVLPYGPTTPTTATPTVAAPVVPVAKGKSSV